MAAPETTNYKLQNWGDSDPGGNPDNWNRYCKYLWGNMTAYNTEYGSGTGEHDRNGEHMEDMLENFAKFEEDTYTGNGADDRVLVLGDLELLIMFIRVWEADTAGTWFRSASMFGDATFDTPTITSAADYIQNVQTAGYFEIGTLSNVNSSVYYYAAYGIYYGGK